MPTPIAAHVHLVPGRAPDKIGREHDDERDGWGESVENCLLQIFAKFSEHFQMEQERGGVCVCVLIV